MPWFTNRVCINVLYSDLPLPHSHPWNYFTLILWGGYEEKIGESTKIRYPGYFSYRQHDKFHVLKPLGKRAITFFVRGKLKTYTKVLIDGKEKRDVKHWLDMGCTKQQINDSIKIYK